jgi:type IV secretion system protein VirB10
VAAKADADSVLPPIELPKEQTPAPASPVADASTYRIGSVLGDWEDPRPKASAASATCCTAQSSVKTPQQQRSERLLSGVVFARASTAESPAKTSDADITPAQTAAEPATPPASGLSTLLQTTLPLPVHASVLPTQRLLLPKGAFVDCTLETALDSTLPGLATCLTAVDTFSADGSVVLLERGTKLIGETRGEVAQGSSRLFVLWTEARTPQGVVVALASPGTDELGRSGLPGKVDRHFMERFGAAILVSVIDGAIQAAVAHQTAPGSTVVNTGTTQDVLTEVLKSTINIPPTVTKQQGDRIQILVARDLDFRSVYTLASQR